MNKLHCMDLIGNLTPQAEDYYHYKEMPPEGSIAENR